MSTNSETSTLGNQANTSQSLALALLLRRGNVRHEFFEQRAELIFLARLGAVVTGPISADSLILVVACGEWPSAGAVKGTSHS